MLEWKDVPVGVANVKDKKHSAPFTMNFTFRGRLQNLEATNIMWILYHALIHYAIATAQGTHG